MPKRKKRKPAKSPLSLRTKLLFLIGIILIIIPAFFYTNQTIQLALFTPKVIPVVKKAAPIPIAITIPSVGINLPVKETYIRNHVWDIASDGASHLAISARPTEKGPIILYGHNTIKRFGYIRNMKKGMEITIKTADNRLHRYTVVKTVDVNPDQMSVFFEEHGETLFLYTCDGFADLKRFVVIAKPE